MAMANAEGDPAVATIVKSEPWFYGRAIGQQLFWPGVKVPGFESQCWGCRTLGKRSAEADPKFLVPHPYYHPIVHVVPAVATVAPIEGEGVATHPNGGKAHIAPQTRGIKGKRSADADPEADPQYLIPYYGYAPLLHTTPGLAPVADILGDGKGTHPNGGQVYIAPKRWPKKRSADPEADPQFLIHPYGFYGYAPIIAAPAPALAPITDVAGDGKGTHPNGGTVYIAPKRWP